jgi:PilX N-terminal
VRTNRQQGIALITALLVLVLISAIIVGFSWLVMTDQTMSGAANQRQESFYAAEAGMEKLTASLNTLFGANYSPSGAEINALAGVANQPTIPGVTYVDPKVGTAGSGYSINFAVDGSGNPLASNTTITSGPYQGMQGLVTPYTLNVVAESPNGGEVKLQREVQTVGIPLFQFGMFSQTDLSFFAGPDFSFGGRVHTNGDLYLASGSTLELGDKVTAVGEVIRTNLSNGWPTSNGYTGTVSVLTAPGNYRALQTNEGSLVNTIGSVENANWPTISMSTYNGYIRTGDTSPPLYPTSVSANNSTGVKPLNITIATPAIGGSPIDLIKRPQAGEDASAPGKLSERYYSLASLRILLSDNPSDITGLPCETSSSPVDLSLMAQPVASWPNVPPYSTIKSLAASYGTHLVPLAASGAGATYSSSNGYWVPANAPIITGWLKIEAQTSYPTGVGCGSYVDVTNEILALGYAGANLNPVSGTAPPTLPALPGSQIGPTPGNCLSPDPNAVLILERVRDNPSTRSTNAGCGVSATTYPTNASDYWPNALFDSREGNARDWCPNGSGSCSIQPELSGVMDYIQLDVGNLAKWFRGAIGASGPSTKDSSVSANDFAVYFSDRRGNYISTAPAATPNGPEASPSGHETGEYGFTDNINPASQYGCPNNALDTGEDFDGTGLLYTYGAIAAQAPYPAGPYTTPLANPETYAAGNLYAVMTGTFNSLNNSAASVLQPNWKCGNPPYITTGVKVWPGWYVNNTNEARENPNVYFRRALKLIDGNSFNLGTCPNGNGCGLAVASENPVYVQNDFNSAGAGCGSGSYGAASIIADAVTFLSDNWNDVNSFNSTYNTSGRNSTGTTYRVAIAAGKGVQFPQPTAYSTYQDFGTDGGVHNFLRFLENMSGQQVNYKGSIVSLFYSRQATGVYKDGSNNTVYQPPSRGYNFDTDFLTPACLPPRTPMFRDTNTIGFTEYLLPN